MAQGFDTEELRAAEALDAAIDATLAGSVPPSGTDPDLAVTVQYLAILHQTAVPDELQELRFGEQLRPDHSPVADGQGQGRAPKPGASRQGRALQPAVQWVSGALGAVLLVQAITLLGAGEQLAHFLQFTYVPHVYQEQGLMTLAIAFGLLLAAFRKTYLPGVVAIGGPMGLLFGVYGLIEIGHTPNPAAEVLHFIQAGLAGLLTILWLRRGR